MSFRLQNDHPACAEMEARWEDVWQACEQHHYVPMQADPGYVTRREQGLLNISAQEWQSVRWMVPEAGLQIHGVLTVHRTPSTLPEDFEALEAWLKELPTAFERYYEACRPDANAELEEDVHE